MEKNRRKIVESKMLSSFIQHLASRAQQDFYTSDEVFSKFNSISYSSETVHCAPRTGSGG